MGHYSQECPSLKNIRKSMQATWSDSDFEHSASTTFEDARYNPNDMLAFVVSMNDSNSDSDYELNSYRVEFFDNLVRY